MVKDKIHILMYVPFIVLILVLSACATKPYALTPESSTDENTSGATVYVSNHGWHTGLILPAKKMNERLPALGLRFGQVPYYEFGWGDAGYYQTKKVTSGLLCRAVIWPTDAVLHVVAVPEVPGIYFPFSEIVRLTVTQSGLESLLEYIISSFIKDADGDILSLDRGIYGDSEFYQACGKYFLTNTCNTWTAKGLKSSGMDICAACKLTAGSIMRYLRKADAVNTTPVDKSAVSP